MGDPNFKVSFKLRVPCRVWICIPVSDSKKPNVGTPKWLTSHPLKFSKDAGHVISLMNHTAPNSLGAAFNPTWKWSDSWTKFDAWVSEPSIPGGNGGETITFGSMTWH